MGDRLFSVEEANALLPQLRRRLGSIQAISAAIERLHPLGGDMEEAARGIAESGGRLVPAPYMASLCRLRDEFAAVKELGVFLKDWDEGLVDFPHMRGGKVVLLCWKLGEDRVHHWHEVEAGFEGRKPLP